ncbi:MAG: metallophosphoesterase [Acidobacteriota bacterium]|nr:metallophosphoesterase [Acidobacteriota bacterium]
MPNSKLPDLVVIAMSTGTQFAVGRLYFSEWRKRLWPSLQRPATALLCLLWTLFVISIPFRFHRFYSHLVWVPFWIRGTLVATGNIWGLASIPSFAVYLVCRFVLRRKAAVYSPERRRLIQTAGTVAVAAPFAAAAFGAIVERTRFYVKETDLPIPDLHPDLEGLRIGQISDLHVSPWLSVRDAGRAVDMLNERKPNLIVVTGDVITQPGDPLDAAIRELGRLRADAGVLGCLGNHEIYCQCENYEVAEAAKYGIDILRSRNRVLQFGNARLNVAGVDFQSIRDGGYLKGASGLIVPGAANLLLSHNPDVFPAAVKQGFDAMLSGHTHGGQVTVEILNQTLNFARFITPYVAGLYRLEGKSCYVTAGLGTIALPVRLGAPPEISVLRLTRA